jgi:hypothetical protein
VSKFLKWFFISRAIRAPSPIAPSRINSIGYKKSSHVTVLAVKCEGVEQYPWTKPTGGGLRSLRCPYPKICYARWCTLRISSSAWAQPNGSSDESMPWLMSNFPSTLWPEQNPLRVNSILGRVSIWEACRCRFPVRLKKQALAGWSKQCNSVRTRILRATFYGPPKCTLKRLPQRKHLLSYY